MKYKVGDKVRIKSLDWYNENKNKVGRVWTSGRKIPFDKYMSKWCGKVMTISDVRADHYTMIEDLVRYWTDEMIEGLVEEPFDKEMEEHQRMCDEIMAIQGIEPIEAEIEEVWHCPEGYIFKDENGNVINAQKIVLEKKKKENKQEITLFSIDYKALLKFKNFVQRYYPNYHMCSKCGELVPDNICVHCHTKTSLPDKIGLKVDNLNSTQNKIKKFFKLVKWNQTCNGKR